ncbi:MAG: EAL domain-containing protein [Holophagales bacterium]|nr:MAG: EAL domain-containing protein [Holophagales bacterium]
MSSPIPGATFLETLLDGTDEGVLVADGVGTILFANTRVVELWGYRQRELIEKKIGLLFSVESRSPQQGDDPARGRRLEAYRRDGSRFPVEARWISLESGGRTLSIILVRDLSELEAARERMRQFEKALVTMSLGVALTDRDQRLLYLNPALAEMHGYRPEELVGNPLAHFAPEDPAARLEFRELRQLKTMRHEGMHRRKDGSEIPVEVVWDLLTDRKGDAIGLVMICQDIRERRRAEEALRTSEERYAVAVRGANDGIWDWNLESGTIFYSARWKAMLGLADDDVSDRPSEWLDRVHPDDRPQLERKLSAHLGGESPHFEDEHRMQHHDGSYRWILARGLAVNPTGTAPSRLAGSLSDITDRKVHDPLTGMPNRALFLDRLASALGRLRRRESGQLAVLFLDLDRFKVINDSLGHVAGDLMLVSLARRLESCIRPDDTIARLGGDEFTLLLENLSSPSEALAVVEQIHVELARPFQLGESEIFTSVSVGVALSDTGQEEPSDLLRDADAAMYRAKALEPGRHRVFDQEMRAGALAQLRLESDLRRALERGEFRLLYQPVVALRTERVVGFEGLLRWHHPERGVLAPGEFLRAAEETGLIAPISAWGFTESCRQLAAWSQLDPADDFFLAVNLSPRLLGRPEVVDQLANEVAKSGVEPRRLKLEILESALLEDPDRVRRVIESFRSMGLAIAIDDFGTGYSSLAYLHQYPIDELKIDRSFVASLDQGGGRATELVRSIIQLAFGLGLEVVAEGVETVAQKERIQELGCGLAQGFLFARPLPPAEAWGFLRAGPRREARRRRRASAKGEPKA